MMNFNRADASMILMTLVAVFYLYTASKWWRIGYMTFQKLKELDKVATSTINQLKRKIPEKDQENNPEKLVTTEDTSDFLNRIKEITQSTKS